MRLPPLFVGFFSFILGVFFADLLREYIVLLGVFIIIPLCFFVVSKKISALFFASIGFLSGCLFLFFSLPDIEKMHLIPFANQQQKIEVMGMVDNYPLQKNNATKMYIQVKKVRKLPQNKDDKNEYSWVDISNSPERILVTKRGLHDFSYGDYIHVKGEIQRPGEWEKFSYDRFLERDGVYALIKNAQIYKISPEKYSAWQELWISIFDIRKKFEREVRHKLTFPENEYALGIILGAESGIPKHIIDDFNDTGLRHLLALSGMNITILIIFISWIFFFLPISLRIAVTALVILLFVGLTGGSSSVVRAAVMGILGMIALYSGRKMNPIRLILLALFFMTLWNPFLLVSDVSLQFSVAAVLGLLYIVPLFEKTFSSLNNFFPKDLLLVLYATLSAQIAAFPLMVVFFEKISLIAPLTNLIIVPITTFSMFFGFMLSIPFVGWIAVPFAYALLHFSLFIAKIGAEFSFASIQTSGFPIWSILPLYITIIGLLITWKKIITEKTKK